MISATVTRILWCVVIGLVALVLVEIKIRKIKEFKKRISVFLWILGNAFAYHVCVSFLWVVGYVIGTVIDKGEHIRIGTSIIFAHNILMFPALVAAYGEKWSEKIGVFSETVGCFPYSETMLWSLIIGYMMYRIASCGVFIIGVSIRKQ